MKRGVLPQSQASCERDTKKARPAAQLSRFATRIGDHQWQCILCPETARTQREILGHFFHHHMNDNVFMTDDWQSHVVPDHQLQIMKKAADLSQCVQKYQQQHKTDRRRPEQYSPTAFMSLAQFLTATQKPSTTRRLYTTCRLCDGHYHTNVQIMRHFVEQHVQVSPSGMLYFYLDR